MAQTKTKAASKRGKTTTRQKPVRRVATVPAERSSAFAYADRVDPITSAITRLGGSATVSEIFDVLQKSADGRRVFAKPRRINATWRQTVRHMERPPFVQDGATFRLAKANRTTTGSKAARGNGRVSTKRTKRTK